LQARTECHTHTCTPPDHPGAWACGDSAGMWHLHHLPLHLCTMKTKDAPAPRTLDPPSLLSAMCRHTHICCDTAAYKHIHTCTHTHTGTDTNNTRTRTHAHTHTCTRASSWSSALSPSLPHTAPHAHAPATAWVLRCRLPAAHGPAHVPRACGTHCRRRSLRPHCPCPGLQCQQLGTG